MKRQPVPERQCAQDIDAREQAFQEASDARAKEWLDRIQKEEDEKWGPDPEPEPETAPARRPRQPPAAAEETPTARAETPTAPIMDKIRAWLGRQRPSAAETPPEAPVAAETPVATVATKTPVDRYKNPILDARGAGETEAGGASPSLVENRSNPKKRSHRGGR